MLAGALGAIVGDSSLFWIARKSAAKVQGQLDKALENPKVRAGWDALDRSPGLMIVAGRYVPGMRFAVNATMGLSSLPYRRFLPWSVLGGVLWSVYTCALAYKVATTLSGFPLASLVISSLITSAALAAIYFVDRRRRRAAQGAEPTDASAEPAVGPSSAGSGRVVDRHEAPDPGLDDRARVRLTAAVASARSASTRHVSLAVPFRAAERNRRVAASVLAGGIAYRLFLWLLPFGLIVGGALGLMDADSTEEAVASGGLPAAVVDVIGDVARAAESDWWWLLGIGVPLLLWAGYTGAKAVQLIHSLVWDEPPPRTKPLKSSLAFTGVLCAFMAAVALTLVASRRGVARAPPRGRARHGSARRAVALGFSPPSARGRSLAGAATRRDPRRDRLSGAPRADRRVPRAEAREGDDAVREPRRHDDDPLLHVLRREARRHLAHSQQLPPSRAAQSTAVTSAPSG